MSFVAGDQVRVYFWHKRRDIWYRGLVVEDESNDWVLVKIDHSGKIHRVGTNPLGIEKISPLELLAETAHASQD
ncbi:MAG: hypothetical protein MN733_00035 [Nitrososphaera sp.]|nr:hypothetical protein [Nitrososphaera sp.]